jgi:hypothetical protein
MINFFPLIKALQNYDFKTNTSIWEKYKIILNIIRQHQKFALKTIRKNQKNRIEDEKKLDKFRKRKQNLLRVESRVTKSIFEQKLKARIRLNDLHKSSSPQ